MSFDDMKVADLKKVAELYGVDLTSTKKADIIATLETEGVSFELYSKTAPKDLDVESVPAAGLKEPEDSGNLVLIKSDRENPSYATHGVTFTRTHPFQALPESVANAILYSEEGFRLATAREVEEFYQ
jgi:hypothetical protein